MIVINQGRVNYCYKISEENPVIYETVCSNRVKTFIINYDLFIDQKVDKDVAFLWDVLTYTINIRNISENLVKNILIFDKIPPNIDFIENSIEINGVNQPGLYPERLYIGNLEAGKKIYISFKVVIIKCFKDKRNTVINLGRVSYDYIYNIEKLPIRINIIINKVITVVRCNIFTEISEKSKVYIKSEKYEKIKIRYIDIKIKIIEYKVINTSIGYKILIIWKINYLIHYWRYSWYKGCKKYRIYSCDYFSSIIDVPEGIQYVNKSIVDINIISEDCSYNLLEKTNELNIYNTILIYLPSEKL